MSKFQYLLKNVKYATRLLYFPYTHKPLGECVYEENTMDKWHVVLLYFILSSTEIIKFTRKAKARGLNGLVSIIIIEDC